MKEKGKKRKTDGEKEERREGKGREGGILQATDWSVLQADTGGGGRWMAGGKRNEGERQDGWKRKREMGKKRRWMVDVKRNEEGREVGCVQ